MEILLKENLKVEANYKGFNIKTDQPEKSGGDNDHPSPFDYFLVSIGTCAGYAVKSFCKQRDIDDSGIKITLNTSKNNDTGMINKVDINILLPSGFPEKYKNAVVNSANLCAVKKHIMNPPDFNLNVDFDS